MKKNDTSTGLLFYTDSHEKKGNIRFSSEKQSPTNINYRDKQDCTAASILAMFRGTIVSENIASFYLEL